MRTDELKRSVLTAPLWMQATKGSSRHVADAVGVSQSLVSRVWREASQPDATSTQLRARLSERRMVLIGFSIGAGGTCLVLGPSRVSSAQYPAGLSANSTRRLRTVLAADLLRGDALERGGSTELLSALESAGHHLSEAVVLTSGGLVLPADVPVAAHFTSAWDWQRLVAALEVLPEVSTCEALVDLERRVRRWYQGGRTPFLWVAEGREAVPAQSSGPGRDRIMRLESDNELAEDILLVIRQGLVDGTFSSEAEIPLGTLSRKVGAPPRDVRPALRALTDHGLVTAARSDSVVVRIPSLEDASETYMARRALGSIAVRAASRWSPEGRAVVKNQLDVLRESVERNDVTKAHYTDMDFQIALFEASGLSRVPAMLETLTKQAFMHFAFIGARYAFSPTIILEQNSAIFDAIDSGDLRAAAVGWQTKMDDGLKYIAQHIVAMNQRHP
ncbi:GntR family transcriptional regulator [Paenarthrobacter sp. YJN-5]|uniref:GntR family transcriptional regulator n=1 Tax=Paenarthrobacter sp. YJN-5 TaxID=2735316 RepID=UPI0018782591|nr:GntR family transcriptional regulator [Paenarthrobacter sp. YJN-5]QOT15510.1 GntR family transcriptional regulator [Paenarthrobacter sp. YJN-5]